MLISILFVNVEVQFCLKKKGNVNRKNPIKRYSRESDNFFFLNIVRKILSIVGTD